MEIQVPGSNYGAVNLFVWDIFQDDSGEIQVIDRFNTLDLVFFATNEITLSSGEVLPININIIYGTEIVSLEQSSRQGLAIHSLMEDEQGNNVETVTVLSYSDAKWSISTD